MPRGATSKTNDKMHELNPLMREWLDDRATMPFWKGSTPRLDYRFLERLLGGTLAMGGDPIHSGKFANALDLWVACELEHAGFVDEGLWPRAAEPRVLDPTVARAARLPAGGSRGLIEACGSTDASVMGSVYAKQVDVGMASWPSGPELLISTKTMSGSFGKNLANRFEEAYGDVKNLRTRHPLAAHGFLFLARDTLATEGAAFERAVHMLRQLSRAGDAYDAVCLLLVAWDDQTMDIDENGEVVGLPRVCATPEAASLVPEDLSAERFFATVIDLVLARAPIDAHVVARRARAGAVDV